VGGEGKWLIIRAKRERGGDHSWVTAMWRYGRREYHCATGWSVPPGARCATRVVRVDGYSVSVYREPMIQSFADATTADLWDERNTKAARRVPRGLWPVVHRKLTMLDSAQRLDDLAAVPGNRLEALAGDRKGQHSIRVNQQYRITFRWEKHDAHNVCCEDYH
jgi:proteic killer suppression protein